MLTLLRGTVTVFSFLRNSTDSLVIVTLRVSSSAIAASSAPPSRPTTMQITTTHQPSQPATSSSGPWNGTHFCRAAQSAIRGRK